MSEPVTKLDSISFFLEDAPLLKDESLSSFLTEDLSAYSFHTPNPHRELLAPSTWHMPEVFRKKLTAFSEHYFNEVNEQNRWTSIIVYNFSNGLQLSSREILRHPFHRIVPRELLPQPRKENVDVFQRWPLGQQKENVFLSHNMREVADIMQALFAQIVTEHRQGKIPLYIQTKFEPERGFLVRSVSFDPSEELDWRVEFADKQELIAEFKLVSSRKKFYHFFDTFALQPEDGAMIVHPWLTEFRGLEQSLSLLGEDRAELTFTPGAMPSVEVTGDLEAKSLLKHLRHRSIPVKITGGSETLGAERSLTDIYLNDKGDFYIQHRARVMGQKDVISRGWTPRSVLYLRALSEGLPYLLNSDAKDMATKSRRSREWDIKLLKHLGVLQYLLLETLSYHFEGELTDGRIVSEKEIFPLLHGNVHALLIAGSGVILAKDMTLSELISKPVLSCFEDFVSKTLKVMKSPESFYSEAGEVILEGVVEREFRLIFELLKKLALRTRGEIFRKARTSFLSRIWDGDAEKDSALKEGLFHFPRNSEEDSRVHETLESLQDLLLHGFKLFYHGQALQELNDDDFLVDFNLQADGHGKDFNWFELHPRFFLHGVELDPNEVGALGRGGVIEHEGKIYLVPKKQMPSLRRLENFWLKLQKGKKDAAAKKNGDKIYQLPRHQVLELLALRASGYGIRGDEEWKRLCAFYDSLGETRHEIEIPKTVKADLKPYQLRGVQWLRDLYSLRLGALLADDMGLGKTLQTLTFLEDLRSKGELGQVLVVVPSSLIYNWQSEIEKFTPQLPLAVFTSKDMDRVGRRLEHKEDLVVMTTYGLLMEQEQFFAQYKYRVVIFDEAQNLKNITTKRTSSARSLAAQFKICLTGTPMENHYGEFYSLVDILVPGSLGKVEDFRREFVNTDLVSREQMEDLKLKIKPLLLRRTKKEILDQLPEKQETKVSIAFEERQKEIYRDIALAYNNSVQESLMTQGEARVQLQMLTALLRLRQACSDPGALPNIQYDKVPPKLEALLDSLTEIVESGESALVFTQFIQTLEHTAKLLAQAGIPVFVLHGGVPTKQRQKILTEFNKLEGGAVLVMTLKTGGVGLNLTKASYVFHLEPWWNPSVENQATDRAHRLGQNKAVQVFRYIMHESLEEKIELLKVRKDKKFEVLFSNSEKEADLGPGSGALSKDDFDMLLGLK
ncbi:hypothetical protein AZI86_16425 [Bdellovibrio bacteriovorus]|uniref:Helicase n=1 Tax=Bdellovibrio bacteriovorus TaxID=959 RepID=A0A150WH44_BDEBC|nr:hypothetical protein AZI86_16425 [Bdellovibrio bacteriovorus]